MEAKFTMKHTENCYACTAVVADTVYNRQELDAMQVAWKKADEGTIQAYMTTFDMVEAMRWQFQLIRA